MHHVCKGRLVNHPPFGRPAGVLRKEQGTFEVVWDNARVTNWDNKLFPQYLKHRGDDFVRDWPKDREKAEQYFT